MSEQTEQQQQAIQARGNVLVAAGAGTGKTSTVTERCLDLVLRERCSLERILMVTFTEAAAAEMRERLGRKLRAAADQAAPDSADAHWLAEQLALLETAPISTLHSFCLDLVRRHFHMLGLDPQFTVLDEAQTKPLMRAALDELFQRHYAADDELSRSVRELVRDYGRGGDAAIRELVLKLHTHTQALADPQSWYAGQLAMLTDEEPRRWWERLVEAVIHWANLWRPVLEGLIQRCENLDQAQASLAGLPVRDVTFEQAAAVVASVVTADQRDWPHGTKTHIRNPIEKLFADAEFLAGLAADDGAALAQDWAWVRPPMQALLQLAREFGGIFANAKRELGGIDFADQEQFALQLLHDAAGQPSAIARNCRVRFDFVFVDECQDINAAQDAILRAVSRAGEHANRFLVGDVKQSIYRFRQADPRIFQEYQARWGADRNGRAGSPLPAAPRELNVATREMTRHTDEGRVIPLTQNFRSREALLNFVNAVFGTLMRPVLGDLRYGPEEALRFGDPKNRAALANGSRTNAAPEVELHVITNDDPEDTGVEAEAEPAAEDAAAGEVVDVTKVEREARLIARRLRELRQSQHQIWDRDTNAFRAVDYRDMVVLVRSLADRGEMFAKAFHQEGVPLHAARAGFLEALEVTDLLNLLRLLDNPLQDLPLLAVLRSPLVGFSVNELAALRALEPKGLLWFALRKVARDTQAEPAPHNEHAPTDLRVDPLTRSSRGNEAQTSPLSANVKPPHVGCYDFEGASKAAEFLARWQQLRELLRHTSLTQCLETALAQTHYEPLLLAGERGSERVANVRRLVDLARRFDPYQREGLFRFLQFIREQEEAEVRHEPATLNHENAVRLMTIHASKGLEFPVVVLAGLGINFNLRDLYGDILLSEQLGLCPKVLPPATRRRYPSIAHWLGRQREQQAALGEELRLLYVAFTRARDTLLLVGTAARKKEADRWRDVAPVTDLALLKARCPLDWLRLWFIATQSNETLTDARAGQSALLAWRFHDGASELIQPAGAAPLAGTAPPEGPDAATIARLRERLQWRYPHDAATSEPAKTTVTALRRRAEMDDASHAWFPGAQGFASPRHPRAGATPGRAKLSAAEIGTAHHSFLQHLALDRTRSELDLRNEAMRIQAAGWLTDAEIAALDFVTLRDFWQSAPGRLIAGEAARVQRELPFTARLTGPDLRAVGVPTPDGSVLSPDEFVVIQGVADLVVIRSDELWVLDFKTDAVTAADLPERVEFHRPQLQLYALALERIYLRPVRRLWLHFLKVGRTVALRGPEK